MVQQTDGEANVYVLKDPWAHRYYRLREFEYSCASLLTGRNDLQTVADQLEKQGLIISTETIEQFVARLRKLGLLEEDAAEEEFQHWDSVKPAVGWSGFRVNPMFVKFPLANPNPILGKLAWLTRPLFTRSFVTLALVFISAAIAALWLNWEILALESPYLVSPEGLIMSVLMSSLVITFHELAHAIACRQYGGQVPDMGFALYLFQPYFYTDVSDAWILPRNNRLWITLAGPFFEAVLWAGSIFVWLTSTPETDLHRAALTVVVSSGIKLVWNLNPLLRLDGYYLLMDLLQIPNLRSKAWEYWLVLIKGIRHGRLVAGSKRDLVTLGGYGLLAGLFMPLMVLWLLRRLWRLLVLAYPQHYQWVFLLFLAVPSLSFAAQSVYRRRISAQVRQLSEAESREEAPRA